MCVKFLHHVSPLFTPLQPCDKDFETIADTSYMAYCIDQQIASSVTKYTWYVSSNGLDYHPIRQATIFTSSDGKVLEPVYLNQSIYVRCSARAVTTSGTQGGTRHSTGVRLSHTTLSSEMRNSVSSFFELYKSDGFTGHPEVSGTVSVSNYLYLRAFSTPFCSVYVIM